MSILCALQRIYYIYASVTRIFTVLIILTYNYTMIPKECINSNCNSIIYVQNYELHLLLQCESCTDNQ